MSKKDLSDKGKSSLDDFDWPDVDFGDVDQEGGKNDRNPVTRVGKSALKAAAKTAIDPNQLERTASRVLPGAYGESVKPVADAARQAKSLYDTSSSEVRETILDMRRTVGRAAPSFKGKVPDKVYDFLEKLGIEDDTSSNSGYAVNRNQQNDAEDAHTIDSIFGKMAEQNKTDRENREAEKAVQRTQAKKRFTSTITALQSIDYSLNMARDYNENIDAKWKRATLKLQLQSTRLMGDLVDITMRSQKDIVDRLGMITKNTALPEAAKIRQSEEFQRMTSQRLLGKISDGLFGNTADYLGRSFGNLSRNVQGAAKDKLQGLRRNFRDTVEVGTEMMNAAEGMEGQGEQTVMELLFGLGSDYASNRWGGRVRDRVGKIGAVSRNEGKVRYWLENGGRRLHEEAHSRGNGWGFKDWLTDLGRGALNREGLNGDLRTDDAQNGHMPDNFNKMTNRSLIEIIPGLLARIHQEQRRMRLGREDVDLLRYDMATGTFRDMGDTTRQIRGRLVGEFETERNQKGIDNILKQIDPKGQLRPSDREALSRHIVGLNMRGFSWNPTKFANGEFHGKVDPAVKERLQEFVKARYNLDKGTNKLSDPSALGELNAHTRLINSMGPAFKNPDKMIRELIQEGHRDELISLGIIDLSSGKPVINYEKMTDFYLGRGGMGKRPRRRKTAAGVPPAPGMNTINSLFEDEAPIRAEIDYDRLAATLGAVVEKVGPAASDREVMKELLDVMKEQSRLQGERNDYTNLALEEIIDVLMDGRQQTYVVGFQQGDRLSGPQARNWKDRLRSGASNLRRQGSRAWDALGGLSKDLRRNLRSGYEGARGALGTAYRGAKGYLDDRIGQVRAIYVKGRDEAILKLDKLKLGHYIDEKTGDVISRLSDIKGRVIDRETGDVVIDWDDLKKGFYDRSGAEYVVKGAQAMWRNAVDLKNRAMGGLGNLFGQAGQLVGRAARWAEGKLKLLPDVYVKGEAEPRLLKIIMDNEGYLDKKTGNPIRTLADIKGDIVDVNGNKVLSLKDMRKGLVDRYGRPLRGGLGGIVDKVARVGLAARERLSGVWNKAREFGGRMLGRIGGLFGKNMGAKAAIASITSGLDGTPESVQKAQLATQLQILENIIQMNPGRTKVWGDTTGDGVRDGSYMDQMKRRASSAAQKAKDKVTGSNAWGSMMGGLGSLKEFFGKMFGRGKGGDEGDEEGGDTDLTYVDAGGDGDKKGRRGRGGRGGKRGFMRRGWDKLANSRLGNFFGRNFSKLKGGLGLGGGLRAGATGLASRLGMGALARGAMYLGGMALTGLAGIVSSPVLVGAGIVAGVGLAAYGAYRLFRTESRDMPLCRLRLAHYGWNMKDADQAKKFLAFEALMMKDVKFNGSEVVIGTSQETMAQAAEIFGLDLEKEDSEDLYAFAQWIESRFKPVLAAHLTALASAGDWKQLGDIDSKLDNDKKKAFLTSLRSQAGLGQASRMTYGPFGARVMLNTNLALIEQAFRDAEGSVKEQAKKDAEPGFFSRQAKRGLDALGTLMPGVAAAKSIWDVFDKVRSESGQKDLNMTNASAAPGSTSNLKAFLGDAANVNGQYMPTNAIDALRAVRMKAYGLVELERNMIRALIELEQATFKYVSVNNKGQAQFRGSMEDMADEVGAYFAVGDVGSASWSHFLTWFEARFLPVYLKHVGYIKTKFPAMNPANAHKELAAEQQYELAVEVAGATTTYGGKGSSVWSVPLGPSAELRPNTDRSSINGNLEALKDGYTQKRLDEESGKAGSAQSQKVNPNTGLFESVKNFFGFGSDKSQPNASPSGSSGQSSPSYGNSGPTASTAGGRSQAAGLGGPGGLLGGSGFGGMEVVVDHPGGGTTGDINKLPFPTGLKGFEAHKELLAAVSQMTGFPPDLLAGVIATESNFDSSAKPGTSAAQGLGQFIPSTWAEMLKKYGRLFGIAPNTPATDPRANALMTAMYMKENAERIKGVMGQGHKVTDVDLYMAHFLGFGGYSSFLKNPGKLGKDVQPAAARSNPTIFYTKEGRARTVEEIISLLGQRVAANRQRYSPAMLEFARNYTPPKGNAEGTVASSGTATVDVASGSDLPSPGAAGLSPIRVDVSKLGGPASPSGPEPGLDVTALREASNAGGNIATPPSPMRTSAPAPSQGGSSLPTASEVSRESRVARETAAAQQAQTEYRQRTDQEQLGVAKEHLDVSKSIDSRLETIVQMLAKATQSAPPPPRPLTEGHMSVDKRRPGTPGTVRM